MLDDNNWKLAWKYVYTRVWNYFKGSILKFHPIKYLASVE